MLEIVFPTFIRNVQQQDDAPDPLPYLGNMESNQTAAQARQEREATDIYFVSDTSIGEAIRHDQRSNSNQ
ncbi:hypothetical protein ACE3MS_08245 [Paenibacillus dendritiformis]|uniref:Uncharacterized protein n=1 Tax=Paenibacillus macerans TaxID=44252 RepID=A0A090ZVS8_PAEMA|nr:hypothetical protein [Paenibacillus macerans]KFN08231.1 hypothetical protein DJ90_1638 [Paenibacillus macerans]MBS5912065.1 hypothetical protein [Paenibacillus macerans]MCY7557694.1 hypothetical protein [Paenibacillus macerans]MDU5945933.1 hypothetical protein [Paenibacillus macerans]MDU7472543.1 hypothetical protein [Paenibacillus macerans]